jgi:hypothetical protein
MRVIRPAALTPAARRRPLLLGMTMLTAGLAAVALIAVGPGDPTRAALLGTVGAIAIGIGAAWLVRLFRPDELRRLTDALVALLEPTFDDAYTLVVAPRLDVRDAARLDGILVGPAGVRVLTARDWVGRYRVRNRTWEFDAHGRRGWIPCRTNPSLDAAQLADGVGRWARDHGLPDLALRPAVIFPYRHSRIVLEEPADEIVTSDNAPWWANTIGRVRRIDPVAGARVLEAVLDASESRERVVRAPASDPRP